MLERMADLPEGVDGIRASGQVSRDDYLRVLQPMLAEAHAEGRRIRLLYELGPDVESFSPGAAWEDARLGLQHLRLFERCAVVTDLGWLHSAARFVGTLLPCPFEVFTVSERERAIDWLQEPATSTVPHRLLSESGVLVVEPDRPLRAEDFEAMALTVDPWIESHGQLNGLVIRATTFPGWENLGGALRHLQFVRDHHRNVRRVALVSDARLAELAPALAEHLANPEIEQFPYDDLDAAILWAGGEAGAKAAVEPTEPAEPPEKRAPR